MAYQTLYRKYRPKTFELVYGQDVIVKTLKNVIKNDKLSHAYLFTGLEELVKRVVQNCLQKLLTV